MKTKILIGIGLMISTLAFANNKTASKSEGTIKNDVNVNTLPVFTWERFSGEGMTGNSPFLIYSYLRENVEYPEVAMKYNIQGTAVVQFTVTAAGEVTNIKLVNSVCPEIDNEIVRVLKTTRGLWQPGLKNGKPADMEREVALVFQMNEFKNGSNDNLFKEQATTWFKKGSKALFAQNNPERALKYFDKALKYLPNESTILYSRGMAKHLLNDIKGAKDDWTRMYILTARSEMRNGAPMMTEIVGNNSPAK